LIIENGQTARFLPIAVLISVPSEIEISLPSCPMQAYASSLKARIAGRSQPADIKSRKHRKVDGISQGKPRRDRTHPRVA
jgi:hypothetical protein